MLLASVDGRIGPPAEARIPIADEGLTRGDGAFEVMRLHAGRPFALADHLERLARSCAGLRLEHDADAVATEVEALLAAAGPVDALLRIVLTRGGRRILTVEPLPRHGPAARVRTLAYTPNGLLDGLKSLSYAANMLAERLAREQGADEALLVRPDGRVLEGPTWSFFWVADGRLLTPPLADGILDSITRRHVIAACAAQEAPCTLPAALAADEAFIASTARQVLPIAALDDRELPAPGPVTRAAAARFARHVEAQLAVV